ncbi:MAG: bifunctional diaminohydroxyphosphoribosylaminopyrimidine deaminase/5-amino-6-(5-phosphoribosylamino)uracil reductase RibD [Planctomycetes bacterium]|nr:bifunctional diaminohydroxyphosphoribosylaminopyrimidine deaminase/5-amino-6-(5-phosphoribosylamino)uracil reductase RibD [Planctomycetota bacterium]
MDWSPPTLAQARALVRALELARRGEGSVEPNPPVGALVLREDQVIAEGWHRGWGEPHAEEDALRAAGAAARGATLVVTLEPCSARDGTKKRPPCVAAIVAAGVCRVVVGARDPDPRHAGAGLAELARAGVEVVLAEGELAAAATALISRFAAWIERARPWTHLKWSQGCDGAWSVPDGADRTLSSPESRAHVHGLRASVDAILVGSATVLADDPLLTARPPGPRPLVRIVLDARGRIPHFARCFVPTEHAETWWVTAADFAVAPPDGVVHLPLHAPHALRETLLPELWRRGVRRMLVEGGPTVASAFLGAGVVDAAWVFVAPRPAGGPSVGLPLLPESRRSEVGASGADTWFRFNFS